MNIRLKDDVIAYIKSLSFDIFDSSNIWIFGSRADIKKRGGDIDIYLETDKHEDILQSKIVFLREFEKKFGEQKVDLIVNNHTSSKPIFDRAKKEGIKIC